jgi:hypothetical protein
MGLQLVKSIAILKNILYSNSLFLQKKKKKKVNQQHINLSYSTCMNGSLGRRKFLILDGGLSIVM